MEESFTINPLTAKRLFIIYNEHELKVTSIPILFNTKLYIKDLNGSVFLWKGIDFYIEHGNRLVCEVISDKSNNVYWNNGQPDTELIEKRKREICESDGYNSRKYNRFINETININILGYKENVLDVFSDISCENYVGKVSDFFIRFGLLDRDTYTMNRLYHGIEISQTKPSIL